MSDWNLLNLLIQTTHPSALLQADADGAHEQHVVGVRELEGPEFGTEGVAAGRRLEVAEDVGVDGTPERHQEQNNIHHERKNKRINGI